MVKSIYTCENSDGTVYAQFFSDAECTEEIDSHEFTREEAQDIGKAIREYLEV